MRLKFSNFWSNVFYTALLLSFCYEVQIVAAEGSGGSSPKEVVFAGLRIEPKEPSQENPFVGYKDQVSIVQPDVELRVVIFGYGFDNIGNISFVPTTDGTVNCETVEHTIVSNQRNVFISTNHRFVGIHSFPKTDDGQVYHICYTIGNGPYRHLQEEYTFISTKVPPAEHYFPIPIQITIITFLLILSGLFSGLNLGLMSLNPQELMLIIKSGSKTERRYAESIMPVRERGNLLLCSLLIGNVLVNSGISILLDDLTGSGYAALIGASAGIVIFGEIFPQSLCVKKGLAVGAKTIMITRLFMVITWPVAYPISKLLDCILGEEIQSYDRKRLLELIKMNSSGALQEELKIAVGAMEIIDKTVSSIMTKIEDVFMLPDTTVLNTKTVLEIIQSGYTRIPVHAAGDRNNVVSLLFVKDLALLDPDDNFTIKTVCNYHNHRLRFVMEDTPLRVMLEEFKKGEYHLAMVQRIIEENGKDPDYELVGVVTLEDIVEEIIQEEIVDETDAYLDNVNRAKRKRAQQARDVNCFTDTEPRVISVQMQMVTVQWLTANHRSFHADMINPNVLEKLIRQNCRRVELSHLQLDGFQTNAGIPRIAKLYTKNEYSERFILILEGRCMVTIGQDQMTFEAGPWHAFGTEMLERLVQRCESEKDKEDPSPSKSSLVQGEKKLGFAPDYSVVVRDDCTYLEVTANNWLLAYKTTMISRGGARWPSAELLSESGIHRSQTDGGVLMREPLEVEDTFRRSRQNLEKGANPYIIEVQEEAEDGPNTISFKETKTPLLSHDLLISTPQTPLDGPVKSRPLLPSFIDVEQSSPMGVRSSSRNSLDERKTLVVHPQIDAVRRNGKNRSASESEHVELLPRGIENGSPLSDRSVLSHI